MLAGGKLGRLRRRELQTVLRSRPAANQRAMTLAQRGNLIGWPKMNGAPVGEWNSGEIDFHLTERALMELGYFLAAI